MSWKTTSCALLLLSPLAAPLARTAAPAFLAPDEKYDTFRQRFQDAMRINAQAEMKRLVRTMNEQAVFWILETAEAISNQNSEELETRMRALRSAWKEELESDFCDKIYEYFSLLEPSKKTERSKLKGRYDKAQRDYVANEKLKDGSAFALLSGQFKGLAEAFEQVGDKYYASQAWILHGSCHREDMRGKDADLYVTCAAYKRAVQLREEVGLRDGFWLTTKQMYESLVVRGFDRERPDPGAGEPSGETAPKPAPGSTVLTASMGFQRVDDLFAFERPMYYADELYPAWNAIWLGKKGATGNFTTLGKLSPVAHRLGANEIGLDTNGDGTADVRVPLTGKWEPVQFEIGEGEERRTWACLTTVGTDRETFQQVQVNLAPTDEAFQLYFVPAGSMTGEIGGQIVRVLDDNGDGVYGSAEPSKWGHRGLLEGDLQPELDSIVIGGSKRARPWSQYQEIGGRWYELASVRAGKELQATPVELETGTLELKFKGGPPTWLIVRGRNRFADSYFDLSSGKAVVPAGTYEFFYGELRKGKKRQLSKAVILPGPSMPVYTVPAGGKATIELGAPFSFDFQFEHSGSSLKVKGASVVVLGIGGERYERLWDCVPRPEVSWREAGAKRGSKPAQMPAVMDQNELGAEFWNAVWFPLDLELDLRGSHEAIEVQLTEAKNKLFGKIESPWKGR